MNDIKLTEHEVYLRERIDALEAALRTYGGHQRGCIIERAPPWCSCGWIEAFPKGYGCDRTGNVGAKRGSQVTLEEELREGGRFGDGCTCVNCRGADRIRALEAELADVTADYERWHQAYCDAKYPESVPLSWKQTAAALKVAEAYAARNALRVIEVESVLRSAHAELTDHGHQELPECECRIAHVLAGSQTETKGEQG